jgi:hypothetical protein
MKGVVRSLEMLFEYEAVYQSPMPELERDRVKAIVVDSEERRRRRLVSLG